MNDRRPKSSARRSVNIGFITLASAAIGYLRWRRLRLVIVTALITAQMYVTALARSFRRWWRTG